MQLIRRRTFREHRRSLTLGALGSLLLWLATAAPAHANEYSFCNEIVAPDKVCAQRFVGQAAEIRSYSVTDDGAATGRESRAWLIQYLDVPGPEILRLRTYYNRGFNFQWACGYARLGATSIVPVAAIHGCGTYGFVPRAYDPGYIECGAVGSVYFTDRIHGFTDPNARGVTIRGTSCDQVVSRVYRQKIH